MTEYQHSIGDAMALAAQKVSLEGWGAYSWEAVAGGAIVKGCVPDGVYSRGPRKGKPRFSRPIAGTQITVVVSTTELNECAARYESAKHKCWECKGSGMTFASWSSEGGTRHRECRRCGGSGRPTDPDSTSTNAAQTMEQS